MHFISQVLLFIISFHTLIDCKGGRGGRGGGRGVGGKYIYIY